MIRYGNCRSALTRAGRIVGTKKRRRPSSQTERVQPQPHHIIRQFNCKSIPQPVEQNVKSVPIEPILLIARFEREKVSFSARGKARRTQAREQIRKQCPRAQAHATRRSGMLINGLGKQGVPPVSYDFRGIPIIATALYCPSCWQRGEILRRAPEAGRWHGIPQAPGAGLRPSPGKFLGLFFCNELLYHISGAVKRSLVLGETY